MGDGHVSNAVKVGSNHFGDSIISKDDHRALVGPWAWFHDGFLMGLFIIDVYIYIAECS